MGTAWPRGLIISSSPPRGTSIITLILHDNRVYGLTTGQYTPTSPLGFKGKSTPAGTAEHPMNPLELMLVSGASYIARGYTHGIEQLQKLFKEAILHKGFSFVDVLQVCVSYNNLYESYNKWTYDGAGQRCRQASRRRKRSSAPGTTTAPRFLFPWASSTRLMHRALISHFRNIRPNLSERDGKIKALLENFI